MDLAEPERFLTIGVNDVGRLFQPDYLVVLNGQGEFAGDRYRFIAESAAKAVFSHLELRLEQAPLVRFELGERSGVDLSNPDRLPFTKNSPYVAVALAAYMGARRIGLIGVDFTPDHFFGPTGIHSLAGDLADIDAEFARLGAALAAAGIELFNLSERSQLSTLSRLTPAEFAAQSKSERSLSIVSYSATPLVGVPAILARCIEAQTPHRCRAFWSRGDYGNGIGFEGAVTWSEKPDETAAALAEADLVLVHNGVVAPAHRALIARKPSLTLAWNALWNVDRTLVEAGNPGLVIARGQSTDAEFADWLPFPNPMPLWEPAFAPASKPGRISIVYTPAVRTERFDRTDPMHWHGKGFETTMRVLNRLAARADVDIFTNAEGGVEHNEVLARKRHAHIVIDECATGSFHRNSLEGLAAGAVVVNGLGIVPGVADALRACAPESDRIPFECCDLEHLQETLDGLVALGPEVLAARGHENRRWMERHWQFADQWRRFWLPAVDRALNRRQSRELLHRWTQAPPPVIRDWSGPVLLTAPQIAWQRGIAPGTVPGLTVIVPFDAGREDIADLACGLGRLRQMRGISGVVVVEMGSQGTAGDCCGRHAATWLFVRQAFERTRAIVLPEDFAERALVQCERQGLDCLLAGNPLCDLEASASVALREGAPFSGFESHERLSSAGAAGVHAAIVRTSFVRCFGGMPDEGLAGWMAKVQCLARGDTGPDGAPILRLHRSGSASGDEHSSVALSGPTANPAAFLDGHPPPESFLAPWPGTIRLACAPEQEIVGLALRGLYGHAVELCSPEDPNDFACPPLPAIDDPHAAARMLAIEIARMRAPC